MLGRIESYSFAGGYIHGCDAFSFCNCDTHQIGQVILALGIIIAQFFNAGPEPGRAKAKEIRVDFADLALFWRCVFISTIAVIFLLWSRITLPKSANDARHSVKSSSMAVIMESTQSSRSCNCANAAMVVPRTSG